jgi:hypothetical protein
VQEQTGFRKVVKHLWNSLPFQWVQRFAWLILAAPVLVLDSIHLSMMTALGIWLGMILPGSECQLTICLLQFHSASDLVFDDVCRSSYSWLESSSPLRILPLHSYLVQPCLHENLNSCGHPSSYCIPLCWPFLPCSHQPLRCQLRLSGCIDITDLCKTTDELRPLRDLSKPCARLGKVGQDWARDWN